eukprot:332322_1
MSNVFYTMINNLRDESRIHNIIRQMILLSKFHHKCISLQQRKRIESSLLLRKKWHRTNWEQINNNNDKNETAQILNNKWNIMSNEIDSLYSEASKILSHRIRTFSMFDQHHPYLNVNKLELFGDAIVNLSSPVMINKKNDKKWVDYVHDQNININEYVYKQYPRFTKINNKQTIVTSPIDEHFQKKVTFKSKPLPISHKSDPLFLNKLDSTIKTMISEHKENGKSMIEITRDKSMQKIRQVRDEKKNQIRKKKLYKKTGDMSIDKCLTVDTHELNKGEMILHCDDGITKKIVMLYIDESGLNMIIGEDIYSLINVRSVSLGNARQY